MISRKILKSLFCVDINSVRTMSLKAGSMTDNVTQQQITQLDDKIPLVDVNDKVLGPATKRDCHVRRRGNEKGLLHRAFSVFLFNSNKEILLQQRSSSKITFPNYYTNTCCSHPRFNDDELDEADNKGIRLAAQRRMNFELGISIDQIPIECFDVLTRVHYSAKSDGNWCEHEIDYILICQRDVDLKNVNSDEVQRVLYKSKDDFRTFIETSVPEQGFLITPWFRYVVENFLYEWWDDLDDLSSLKNNQIHRAGSQS